MIAGQETQAIIHQDHNTSGSLITAFVPSGFPILSEQTFRGLEVPTDQLAYTVDSLGRQIVVAFRDASIINTPFDNRAEERVKQAFYGRMGSVPDWPTLPQIDLNSVMPIAGRFNQLIDVLTASEDEEVRRAAIVTRGVFQKSFEGEDPCQLVREYHMLGSAPALISALLGAVTDRLVSATKAIPTIRAIVDLPPMPEVGERQSLSVADFVVNVQRLPRVSPPVLLTSHAQYGEDPSQWQGIAKLLDSFLQTLQIAANPFISGDSVQNQVQLRRVVPKQFERNVRTAVERMLQGRDIGPFAKSLIVMSGVATMVQGVGTYRDGVFNQYPW